MIWLIQWLISRIITQLEDTCSVLLFISPCYLRLYFYVTSHKTCLGSICSSSPHNLISMAVFVALLQNSSSWWQYLRMAHLRTVKSLWKYLWLTYAQWNLYGSIHGSPSKFIISVSVFIAHFGTASFYGSIYSSPPQFVVSVSVFKAHFVTVSFYGSIYSSPPQFIISVSVFTAHFVTVSFYGSIYSSHPQFTISVAVFIAHFVTVSFYGSIYSSPPQFTIFCVRIYS